MIDREKLKQALLGALDNGHNGLTVFDSLIIHAAAKAYLDTLEPAFHKNRIDRFEKYKEETMPQTMRSDE